MNNLSELKMLQARHEGLEAKLKEMDTTNPSFEATQAQAAATSRQIAAIMQHIDQSNKRLSQMLNDAQEHVVGQFINPILKFNPL